MKTGNAYDERKAFTEEVSSDAIQNTAAVMQKRPSRPQIAEKQFEKTPKILANIWRCARIKKGNQLCLQMNPHLGNPG